MFDPRCAHSPLRPGRNGLIKPSSTCDQCSICDSLLVPVLVRTRGYESRPGAVRLPSHQAGGHWFEPSSADPVVTVLISPRIEFVTNLPLVTVSNRLSRVERPIRASRPSSTAALAASSRTGRAARYSCRPNCTLSPTAANACSSERGSAFSPMPSMSGRCTVEA